MASTAEKSLAPNLAAVLLVKRKMAAKNIAKGSEIQAPLPNSIASYSKDKLTYHQDAGVADSIKPIAPVQTSEPPKISRKTKQIEVSLLDKKMDEINRKQAAKTNEAADSWKGFDSLNYGIGSGSQARESTPVPSVVAKQDTATDSPSPETEPTAPAKDPEKPVTKPSKQEPLVEEQSTEKPRSPTPKETTPKPVKSPDKDRPRSKSPLKKEEPRQKTPPQQKTSEKQPSPPPQKRTTEKEPAPPPTQEKNVEKQPSPPPPRQEKNVEKQPSPPPPREKHVEKQPSPPPPPPREKNVEKQPSTPPPREKSVEKQSSPPPPPPRRKSIEKQPSPPPRQKSIEEQPPSPRPRRSKTNSSPLLEKDKNQEQTQPKSAPSKPSTPVIENIVPISSVISNPQIFQRNAQPFEPLPSSTLPARQFKLFPDVKQPEIKATKNAHKSIQRSMDRYRFHVW